MKSLLTFAFCFIVTFIPDGSPDENPKAVLYIFEGSDWCTNCARLEKKVLSDSAFLCRINDMNIRIERIDFPQRKKLPSEVIKYNDLIAEKFSFDGVFPSLIISRPDNDYFRRIIYKNQDPGELILAINDSLAMLYE